MKAAEHEQRCASEAHGAKMRPPLANPSVQSRLYHGSRAFTSRATPLPIAFQKLSAAAQIRAGIQNGRVSNS